MTINNYTPSQIIALYAEQLRKSSPDMGLLTVEGNYKPSQAIYGNMAYDRIVGPDTGASLLIVMPIEMRTGIQQGDKISVTGTLSLSQRRRGDEYDVRLNVTSLKRLASQPLTQSEQCFFDCRRYKLEQGFHNVDQVIANPIKHSTPLSIIAFMPQQSVAAADFLAGLDDARQFVDMREVRINFANSAQMRVMLEKADNAHPHLIVILRGGGTGLDDIDTPEVADALAHLHTPWLYGMGHEQDRLFIRSIADMAVSTPKAAGEYIRKIILQYRQCPSTPAPTAVMASSRLKIPLIAAIIIIIILIIIALILK